MLTPHQFRHLSAKVLLDAQPGGFESVRQLLGHKRSDTTVNAYAGIDSRRAGRHHQRLIENAIASSKSVAFAQKSPSTASHRLGTQIMPRGFKLMLSFANWPTEDRNRWEAAFESGDHFDEGGRGTHLATATRQARQESYGRYLRFLSANHDDLLALPPEARIDQRLVAEYVSWRRTSCGDMSIAIDLGLLRGALNLICPDTDWSWLRTITKKIAATAPRKTGKYHLVTSDRLYALGIELMDGAVADADAASRMRTAHAFQYRDGLIIAFLALIPLRRRTLAALRIGRHLIKAGDLWELDIPASDTKTRRPLDYAISKELSERIDLYLKQFRSLYSGC